MPIWVAWNDSSAERQIAIAGITSSRVRITEAVPRCESGKDVTDYGTAFRTETRTAGNGELSVTLRDRPVFVEQE
jgi:hypothetical protein